ncbi:MAG: hypothetical protein IPI52_00490 [Bacteroidetes bacterium]|nr:hypothetical protein [Bacteroidota bacterium]
MDRFVLKKKLPNYTYRTNSRMYVCYDLAHVDKLPAILKNDTTDNKIDNERNTKRQKLPTFNHTDANFSRDRHSISISWTC